MTQRLTGLLLSHWDEVTGYMVAHNMPEITDLSVSRYSAFLYWYFTRNAEPSAVASFRARLWIPPKGAEVPENSPWSAANERAAFDSFKAQFSGTGG